jgi:hypothetical protein
MDSIVPGRTATMFLHPKLPDIFRRYRPNGSLLGEEILATTSPEHSELTDDIFTGPPPSFGGAALDLMIHVPSD